MEYIFHTDSGHGWLEVGLDELYMLNIADKISGYSYKRGGKAYLEEDCDAGVFINALESKGIKFKYNVINVDGDSIIRSFRRY